MNRKFFSLAAVTVIGGFAVAVAPQMAWAQVTGFGSAGWKQGVDNYWPAHASGRYIQSARNYAQSVQTYMAKATKPEPSVVKEIKTELGRYLDDGQKHLATMKKDFANDKEAASAIDGIEKELTTAISQNREMIACCENQAFDKIATMSCCSDLVKQLDKVHADHVALMRKLATKDATQAAK